MQSGGSLVVYNSANQQIWASNTNGYSGVYLSLGSDGNVVLNGTSGPWNTQSQVYNRQGAVNYANTWALSANPNYPRFSDDCTDFLSQAVNAGGGYPQVGGSSQTDDTQWWIHNGTFGFSWSHSWSVALDNLTFFQNQWPGGSMGSLPPGGTYNPYLPGAMTIGDTIYYDWGVGQGISHSTIVVSPYGEDSGSPGYYGALVDEHTNDRSNVVYNLGPYNVYWQTTTLYFEHIY